MEVLRCPACGYLGDEEDYDVMGVDDPDAELLDLDRDTLFCLMCGAQVDPELIEPRKGEEA